MSDSFGGMIRDYAIGAAAGIKRFIAGVLGLAVAIVLTGVVIVAFGILAVGLAMLGTGLLLAAFGYVTLKIARRGLS